MKPDEEMHADIAEEVEIDPGDLYTDLGILIIEGRIPGLTERGYGEGPHCLPVQGQNRHQCDPTSPECQHHNAILKHMRLLWKNGIPMSIEVLLYPECCASSTHSQTIDSSSVPDISYLLLEQWTVHMLPKRVMDATMSCRGLIQAVRSFLHFSQLSAWLSLTGGQSPQNVHYSLVHPVAYFLLAIWVFHSFLSVLCSMVCLRLLKSEKKHCYLCVDTLGKIEMEVQLNPSGLADVRTRMVWKSHHYILWLCVPEESFSSKFTTMPDHHAFPVANVGRSNAMKVIVRSHPRCGKIPIVTCNKHDVACQASASCRLISNKMQLMKPVVEEALTTANVEEEDYCPEDGIICEQPSSSSSSSFSTVPSQKSVQNRSPVESFLGDSLLDPPSSLQMYPKRYQSPSRCGSPSIEVPEHLMFGKAANARREAERNRIHLHNKERSRPQRRPVVERFLNKNFGDINRSSEDNVSRNHPLYLSEKSEGLKYNLKLGQENTQVCNYVCTSSNDNSIPREEMEHVLSRLRQRCAGTKHSTTDSLQFSFQCKENKSEMYKTIPCQTSLPSSSKHKSLSTDEYSLFERTSKKQVMKCKETKCTSKCIQQKDVYASKVNNTHKPLKTNAETSDQFHIVPSDKNNTSTVSSNISNSTKQNFTNNSIINSVISKTEDSVGAFSAEVEGEQSSNSVLSTYPKVVHKILKDQNGIDPSDVEEKCQKLLHSKTWTEGLSSGVQKTSPLVQNLIKAGNLLRETELDNKSYLVPSADQKAQFRRSLDSATYMVFHQKTGLPLTSSPAPIRKSGTCFDFDSSLTSVSAIKRALFEKEPEGEFEKNLLSTSAPASITTSNLLGNFEESVLNGRLEPVSTVEGFTAELGASGSFCPRHITLPVTVFFYTFQDTDKMASPYLGHINLGKKGYHVPKKGTVQVTLFNPHQTVVKMFVVRYDLCDMPVNCQTFVRQRTLYMPVAASIEDPDSSKWLRYLIHLRFSSSRSGRIYLHTDIRIIIFRKSDLDAATIHSQRPYELRSFTQGPSNPKFSPLK